jgi:hypothetical protein
MELKDLTLDERVALVALIELVTEADAVIAEDEASAIDAVVEALGEEAYSEAADAVDERFDDQMQLREYLPTITRRTAQHLIYGTVLEAAMVNSVDPREGELLDWLAETWDITERLKAPEE